MAKIHSAWFYDPELEITKRWWFPTKSQLQAFQKTCEANKCQMLNPMERDAPKTGQELADFLNELEKLHEYYSGMEAIQEDAKARNFEELVHPQKG